MPQASCFTKDREVGGRRKSLQIFADLCRSLQVDLEEFSINADEKCERPMQHASMTPGKFCSCDKGRAANWDQAVSEAAGTRHDNHDNGKAKDMRIA
jgi:hypothetical protein